MVKLLNIRSKDTDGKLCVLLYADDFGELNGTSCDNIEGLSDTDTLSSPSFCINKNAEMSILDSDGNWN